MNTAQGFAVADDTGILVKTVSPTRRAAIVNWLVAECGVMVRNSFSDQDIEGLFANHQREKPAAQVIEVEIMRVAR